MSIVDINWKPTNRQLRQFGAICLFALPFVGWMWGASWTWVGGLGAAGAVIAALSFIAPIVIKPIFLALTLITAPIGFVLGELMVVLVYYGVVTPLGILGKVVGRDRLQRKLDRSAETYWQKKKKPTDAACYYRQS